MKRYIIPVAAFIAGMAIVPSVFADVDSGTTAGLTTWSGGKSIVQCLGNTAKESDTCTLESDVKTGTNKYVAVVNKNKVLDLGGHTLTIETGYQGNHGDADGKTAIDVAKDASLTITNGTVISEKADEAIRVGENATLTINANVKDDVKTADDAKGAKIVLAAGRTLEGNLTVDGATAAGSVADPKAVTVEINGTINGAYKQTDYVNGTINGAVTYAGNAVEATGRGSLTLNHAAISSTGSGASAVVLYGANGTLTIKNCSVLSAVSAAGAPLYIGAGADVASLTIKNSTLQNTQGSSINGGEGSKVETVAIDGSRFVAKSDAKVKAGASFVKATYDGHELAENENVLSTATGSYGVETVVCDAEAAEPGEGKKGEETENPNTADTIATYLTIATVALLGLGATAFVAKKSNR